MDIIDWRWSKEYAACQAIAARLREPRSAKAHRIVRKVAIVIVLAVLGR